MAAQEIAPDVRIKELTEENELLLEQLHVVQEELEKYHYKLKDCEQRKGMITASDMPTGAGTAEAAAIFAENQKLQAIVELQKTTLRIETQNSLPSRLGNILIAGVGSAKSILSLPGKLRKLWKALDRTIPPAELGGKTFQKVIEAHGTGGQPAVEKLLDSVFLASPMRANAYTALARHLMPMDVREAAANARLAWETDPRPYRLKWLAFRLHDADDIVTAEALLDVLPPDMPMSESEQRQAMQIRYESQRARMEQARKKFEKYQREAEQIAAQQSEKQKQAMERLSAHAEELQKTLDQYKREADQLRIQQDQIQKQAAESKNEFDALAVQTAYMLKNILMQFEPDKAVLSKMMRIVMGVSVNK